MPSLITAPAVCGCGHEVGLHDIGTTKALLGVRTVCSVMDRRGQCACRRFVDVAAPGVSNREYLP